MILRFVATVLTFGTWRWNNLAQIQQLNKMPTECGLEDGQLFKILLVPEDADDAPAYLGVGIN